jgi:hypothetical protein
MNAARLSSVTAWTVVQLCHPGQMHTSSDDWRYTRAAPQVIVAPAGSFRHYTIAINPTGALEMHQKNGGFKSIEDIWESAVIGRCIGVCASWQLSRDLLGSVEVSGNPSTCQE